MCVGLDHVASVLIPQSAEWQRIGNQIDAAMIFARADLVRGASERPNPLAVALTQGASKTR